MKTPATLTGLATKNVTIRIDLPGYGPLAQDIDVPKTGVVTRKFSLIPAAGRLVLAGLPRGASVVIDGTEYLAGEVVDVVGGKHEVRVIVGGKTIVRQQLETTSGHQVWKLAGDRLVAN